MTTMDRDWENLARAFGTALELMNETITRMLDAGNQRASIAMDALTIIRSILGSVGGGQIDIDPAQAQLELGRFRAAILANDEAAERALAEKFGRE